MALNTHHEPIACGFDTFHQAVCRTRGHHEAFRHVSYRLMMEAVHSGDRATKCRRQPRTGLQRDGVSQVLSSKPSNLVVNMSWQFGRQILIQRAARGHRKNLDSAAYAEHRKVIVERARCEGKLELVPRIVHIAEERARLSSVSPRCDVVASRQQKAIDRRVDSVQTLVI